MTRLSLLGQLFAYDAWANREVLGAMASASSLPSESLRLMNHVLSAQKLWLERLQQQPQTLAVWPELELAEGEELFASMRHSWAEYLCSLDESQLDVTCTYRNSQGEQFTNRAGDILIHVVLHSAYHRGQIAGRMRAAGLTPAYTDYIHGVRQGLLE